MACLRLHSNTVAAPGLDWLPVQCSLHTGTSANKPGLPPPRKGDVGRHVPWKTDHSVSLLGGVTVWPKTTISTHSHLEAEPSSPFHGADGETEAVQKHSEPECTVKTQTPGSRGPFLSQQCRCNCVSPMDAGGTWAVHLGARSTPRSSLDEDLLSTKSTKKKAF